MKQYIFFLCGLLVLPFFVHAQTPQSQIDALLAQVQYLQSLLSAIEGTNTAPGVIPVVPTTAPVSVQVTTSAPCVSVSRDLRAGATGADVTSLQTFLAADTSVYPEALITGYYGTLTVRAVERFQIKYGVVSSGTPATTGFGAVGPKTRAALATACGKSSNAAIARDLVVSPRIGQVPLLVSATFSLNGSSCSSFSLDWETAPHRLHLMRVLVPRALKTLHTKK